MLIFPPNLQTIIIVQMMEGTRQHLEKLWPRV